MARERSSSRAAQAIAARLEIDRRREESVLRGRIQAALARARRLVPAAIDIGAPPAQAIRAGMRGLDAELTAAALASHLRGAYRVRLNVQRYAKRKGLALSTSAFDGAVEFLQTKLLITPDELRAVEQQYRTTALRAVKQLSDTAEAAVGEALSGNLSAGGSARDGIRAVNDALERAGVGPLRPYRAEAVVRTQTQLAYSAGRTLALRSPALVDALWGFEYAAILDDRVRPSHREMDGTRAPKEDPIWQRWTPPNGYNCRCAIVEVWSDERIAEATPAPDVAPDKGFAFNPGDVYRSTLDVLAGL